MPNLNRFRPDVNEVLNPGRKYKPEVLRAMKAFARSKPWRGTFQERGEKFQSLNVALAAAYGIEPPELGMIDAAPDVIATPTGPIEFYAESECDLRNRHFVLRGLSVTTYLQYFAMILGKDPFEVMSWSINLFARIFPRSFAACDKVGPFLIKRS